MMKHMLMRYVHAILKRWWMLGLIVVFAVGTAYGLTKYKSEFEYTATTKLIVNIKPTANQELLLNDVLGYAKVTKTYSEMIKTEVLANDVIDKLKLKITPPEFLKRISVAVVPDTQILSITAKHSDQKLVAQIADETARAFINRTTVLMQVDNIVIYDHAADNPVVRTKPDMKLNVLLALVFAVGGGIFVIVAREHFDKTLKTRDEVRDLLGLPLLGEIGIWKKRNKRRASSGTDAAAHETAAARLFGGAKPSKQHRTILDNYLGLYHHLVPLVVLQEVKSICFASTVSGEGRTTVLTRFGALLAQSGHRVLLIDADVEAPSLHELFHLPAGPGVAECLTGAADLSAAIGETQVFGLDVLPLGQLSQEALRALSGHAFKRLLREAQAEYDIVLIDGAPLDNSLLPQRIAPLCDGVLFIVGSGRAQRDEAILAVEALRHANAHLLGGVLNTLETKTQRPRFFLERLSTRH